MNKLLENLKSLNAPLHANSNLSEFLTDKNIEQMEKKVEKIYRDLLETLLIDVDDDPNSEGTPKRVAKMFVHETLCGRYNPPPKITTFPNTELLDELVFTKCEVKSSCSHHIQPIIGHCYIGILYDEWLMGLSKFDRIVDWFARRGQIQEQMTVQIANFIDNLMKPKALGVVIQASHFCKICRGVKQEGSMITSVMRGELKNNPSMKEEFLSMIKMM